MLDYQSFICQKCGKAVLRTEGTNYCQYCGAKLPELKEIPKVVCPMCHGEGKVDARKAQPFNPTSPYFNVMTNAEQKVMCNGKKIECKCAVCGEKFMARIADRNRGWAKCCSKSCAATLSNKKTGKYRKHLACQSKMDNLGYEDVDYYDDSHLFGDEQYQNK